MGGLTALFGSHGVDHGVDGAKSLIWGSAFVSTNIVSRASFMRWDMLARRVFDKAVT